MSRYKKKVDNKYLPITLILIVISLLAIGIWFFNNNQGNESDSQISQTVEIPKEKKEIDSEFEKPLKLGVNEENMSNLDNNKIDAQLTSPKKEPKLLELDESDEGFRSAVNDVSVSLGDWFKTKDVVRKYIVLVHDISQNQILNKNRQFLSVPQNKMVEADSQGLHLSKQGYRRYDRFANAVASIDVQKGLELYLTYQPLFNKVFKSFSYPKTYNLEDIFLKAAANVLKAPIIETRIDLYKHSVLYKFTDKKLESLSHVEKQMLRMGPENTRKIQGKLRQLAEAISTLYE